MKAKLLSVVFAPFTLLFFGCTAQDGEDITGYEEYTLTIASKKLPGIISSCGNSISAEVFAVKRANAAEWEPLSYISGFGYEAGYEYEIRISETNYLDYSRGEPAWTEYKFLEQISKVAKESEGLPEHFIPEWFFEKQKWEINLAYFIDAEDRIIVENDLTANPLIPSGAFLFDEDMSRWQLIDKDYSIQAQGTLQKKSKDFSEFPETYLNLKPDGSIAGYNEWTFIYDFGADKGAMSYDVFFIYPALKSVGQRQFQVALYKDMTLYYQDKFPDTGVKTVVYSLTLKHNSDINE